LPKSGARNGYRNGYRLGPLGAPRDRLISLRMQLTKGQKCITSVRLTPSTVGVASLLGRHHAQAGPRSRRSRSCYPAPNEHQRPTTNR
jgi:hypothetical protein